MRIVVARAIMRLSEHCLGPARREWAAAMRAEFSVAADAGKPLGFATGCLLAAGREMVAQPEGRFALAAHILAVGVIVPMAALLVWSAALGYPYLTLDGISGWPVTPVNDANRGGLSWLVLLTGLLGAGHVAMAWGMLERDWARVAMLGRIGAAMIATMIAFTGILFLYDPCALPQAIAIGIELATVTILVRWHGELPDEAEDGSPHRR